MKNLKLLLLLVIPALFVFSGCSEEDDTNLSPSLEFLGGSQFVSSNVTLAPGDSFYVGLTANQNATSKSKLVNFKAERQITGQSTPSVILDSTISTSDFDIKGELLASTIETDETFTFTITDKDGEFKSVSFIVSTENATTALGAAQSFSWTRCGSSNNPDLSQWGLSWTSNTSTSAIIADDADKLVVLTSADWTSITTQEALADAVDSGTGVAEYTGVSAQASGTYDDVLATKVGSDYFLIHVTSATVTAGQACGTSIEITGEYKE